MKNNGSTPEHKHNSPHHHIPNAEGIDLEVTGTEAEEALQADDADKTKEPRKGIYKFFNIHVIFALLLILVVFLIYNRISNWGVKVDLDEIFKDGPGTYEDHLDSILPLLDADRNIINGKDPATIVAFGNAPFADDKGSEDNLANLIAERTNATVYNCSVTNSYLAAGNGDMDVFTFYWLAHLATGSDIKHYYTDAKETMGEAYPKDADEVISLLTTIDFNNVDVITIMYDATDYLLGHGMYTDALTTDIDTFTGNLEAGIELIQEIGRAHV